MSELEHLVPGSDGRSKSKFYTIEFQIIRKDNPGQNRLSVAPDQGRTSKVLLLFVHGLGWRSTDKTHRPLTHRSGLWISDRGENKKLIQKTMVSRRIWNTFMQ